MYICGVSHFDGGYINWGPNKQRSINIDGCRDVTFFFFQSLDIPLFLVYCVGVIP